MDIKASTSVYKKMRIAYLADASSIHTRNWAQYFVKKDYEIHVISFSRGEIPGAKVHFIKCDYTKSKLRYLLSLPRIKRTIAKIKPNILHAHFITSYGFIGALTGFHPLLMTAHGSDILVGPEKSQILKSFVKYSLLKADLITSAGKHLTERIRQTVPSIENILTFQYGVDLNVFTRVSEKNTEEDSEIFIISLRALKPLHRVNMLVESATSVLERFPNVKFIILGSGSEEEKIKTYIKEKMLSDSFRFLGHVSHEKVAFFLNRSHIYISCSTSDGTSLSLLEAMASGAFPIVSDIPANRDWISSGQNGFLFNSISELSHKIIEAISDNNLRVSAQTQNREIVQERADQNKALGVMEKSYRRFSTFRKI